MALGGSDVDRPVAGAADVGLAAALEGLKRADLVAEIVRGTVARLDGLTEFVVESLGFEVALLLRDPFVQPEVRFDQKRHLGPPLCFGFCRPRRALSSSPVRSVRAARCRGGRGSS